VKGVISETEEELRQLWSERLSNLTSVTHLIALPFPPALPAREMQTRGGYLIRLTNPAQLARLPQLLEVVR
jgi:hypothetical protein